MARSAPHMPEVIAKAAFETFSELGFSATNLDKIAAHAGVTKGSLYCHYETKQAVILAACQYYYRTWQQATRRISAEEANPLERLRAVLSHSVKTCVIDTQNRVFTAEIFALSLQNKELRSSWTQFYTTVRETYIGLVDAMKHGGQSNVTSARRVVDLMLCTLEGLKQRAAFEPQVAAPEEQEQIVEQLLSMCT